MPERIGGSQSTGSAGADIGTAATMHHYKTDMKQRFIKN